MSEKAQTNDTDAGLRWYARREPLIVLVLAVIAIVFFLAVTGLSNIYQKQRNLIGDAFYSDGIADLQQGAAALAVRKFRAALTYSRGNFRYQLSLAQALADEQRTDEASGYLLNLWQTNPNHGTVNLALARIFADKGNIEEASRYYHNALYAAWDSDPDEKRQQVRLELIRFLLKAQLQTDADSELIALAANVPANSPLHGQLGELFLQAHDYEHALAEFHEASQLNHHDLAAAFGAGQAAFELHRYGQTRNYLRNVIAENPENSNARLLFDKAGLVEDLDPYRRDISMSKRNQIVLSAFAVAEQRLGSCKTAGIANAIPDTIGKRWPQLKAQVNAVSLRRDPDLANEAMDFVFSVEQQLTQCGAPTEKDDALLLVSRLREGN